MYGGTTMSIASRGAADVHVPHHDLGPCRRRLQRGGELLGRNGNDKAAGCWAHPSTLPRALPAARFSAARARRYARRERRGSLGGGGHGSRDQLVGGAARHLSSMVVGTIWYTPKVFGTWWAKLAKVDMDARRQRDDRRSSSRSSSASSPRGCSPARPRSRGSSTAAASWSTPSSPAVIAVGRLHGGTLHHARRVRGPADVADGAEHRARVGDRPDHGAHHRRLAARRHRLIR